MTTPPEPAPVIERAGRTGVAMVATPGGVWLLDWAPQRATFTAAHLRQAPPGWPDEVDYDLGCRRREIVSPLALEEALRFALPLTIRSALGAERDNRPAFAGRRGMRRAGVEVGERPRPADTFPLWSSPAGPVWGALAPWGLSLAGDHQRNAVPSAWATPSSSRSSNDARAAGGFLTVSGTGFQPGSPSCSPATIWPRLAGAISPPTSLCGRR
jgi:hypothetical protein